MGRPRLPVGTHGSIRLIPLQGKDGPASRWRAESSFRDQSGRTRVLKRVRATQEEAIVALKAGIEVAADQFSGIPVSGARVNVLSRTKTVAPPRHHVLYRFYDDQGVLLYVGITMTASHRFMSHRSEQLWWSEVKWINIEDHPDEGSARAAELAAIRSESPKYNIAGTILRFK